MFCLSCGARAEDGDRFCKHCGDPLQGGTISQLPVPTRPRKLAAQQTPRRPDANRQRNPYRDQIAQLRLQLRELRMQLQEVNYQIRGTRSNYFEFDSFVQRGLIHDVGRMIEGAQLFNPYQQRKQLQDRIMQIERELLPLEKAQEQWRLQQQSGQGSF
jgi:uncharacterized coiled-coil DUF342 family protein